ncbi:hypothetical protein NP233_g7241 [Leucocoprinus birnbaumii]|uniref:Cysteine-rich PDZ-binding protein n=1 Tax=Leucocoprinus birnbaumii TaxID=56174 RepID=A0AAD5VV26_9AGAR|nr:hypothetical protein NP233_g7241 [Leucocoprinus birnbaumii]
MVCKKCEKKLSKVAAPDPFTSSSSSIKDGSRKVGENKLLGRPGSSKNRFQVSPRASSLGYLSDPDKSPISPNVRTVSSQLRRIVRNIVTAVHTGKVCVRYAGNRS